MSSSLPLVSGGGSSTSRSRSRSSSYPAPLSYPLPVSSSINPSCFPAKLRTASVSASVSPRSGRDSNQMDASGSGGIGGVVGNPSIFWMVLSSNCSATRASMETGELDRTRRKITAECRHISFGIKPRHPANPYLTSIIKHFLDPTTHRLATSNNLLHYNV